MFWSKARAVHADVKIDDPDIQKYLQVAEQIQESGYQGAFGVIQDFGHKFVSKWTRQGKTLEIGFGRGRQALFFKGDTQKYFPIEKNESYIYPPQWERFPNARIGDATALPFTDSFFDQAVSIYNLEHISDLDKVMSEIKRVLKPKGLFIVALPCENGLLYNLAREMFVIPPFQKRYGINYNKVIAFEHVHELKTIVKTLRKHFHLKKTAYYPFWVPSPDCNFVYCGVFENSK